MKLSNDGIDLLIRLEGNVLQAYRCAADVLTIGVGHTGEDVTEGMSITHEESIRLLKRDLNKFERAVNKEFPKGIKQNRFDAWVLFAFNIGIGGFKSSTALAKAKGAGSKLDVVMWLKKWNKVNGQRNKGLVKRRNAESCVYLSANYHNWV